MTKNNHAFRVTENEGMLRIEIDGVGTCTCAVDKIRDFLELSSEHKIAEKWNSVTSSKEFQKEVSKYLKGKPQKKSHQADDDLPCAKIAGVSGKITLDVEECEGTGHGDN